MFVETELLMWHCHRPSTLQEMWIVRHEYEYEWEWIRLKGKQPELVISPTSLSHTFTHKKLSIFNLTTAGTLMWLNTGIRSWNTQTMFLNYLCTTLKLVVKNKCFQTQAQGTYSVSTLYDDWLLLENKIFVENALNCLVFSRGQMIKWFSISLFKISVLLARHFEWADVKL